MTTKHKLLQCLVLFSVFMPNFIQSQNETMIDGIWSDDYQQDINQATGWYIFNSNQNNIDLGNPLVIGDSYIYHGPFTKINITNNDRNNWMKRRFYCYRESVIYISYSFAYCGTADILRLYGLNSVSALDVKVESVGDDTGHPFETIETGTKFENNLTSLINTACDTPNEYKYQNISAQDMGTRTATEILQVNFRWRIDAAAINTEYGLIYNIKIECREITNNPTKDPTISPTTPPTPAPTVNPTALPTKYPTPAPTADPTISPTKYPTPAPTVNPTALPTKYPTSAPTADPTKGPLEPDRSTFKPTITLCVDVNLSFDYIENVNDLSQQQIKHMISNKTKQFIEIELKQRADADDCCLTQYNHTVQIISVLNKAMVNITACFDCNGYKLSIDNNNNPDLEKEFVTLFNDNPILQISLDIVNDRDDEVDTTTTNIDHFDDKERDKNKENSVGIIIGVLIGLFCCCIWITVFVWKYEQKQNVDNMKLQIAESSTVNATNNNNLNQSNQSKQIGEILVEDDTNSDGDLDGVVTAGGDDEEVINDLDGVVTAGGDNAGFVVEDDEEVIGNTLNKVNSLSSDLEGGLSNVVNDEIIIGDDEENDIMTPKGNEILIDDEGDINHNIVSLGE